MGKVDQDNERVTRAIGALKSALWILENFDTLSPRAAYRALVATERLTKALETSTKDETAEAAEHWLGEWAKKPESPTESDVSFARTVSCFPKEANLATVVEAIERLRKGHITKAVALVMGIKDTAQLRNTRNAAKRRRSKVTRTAA